MRPTKDSLCLYNTMVAILCFDDVSLSRLGTSLQRFLNKLYDFALFFSIFEVNLHETKIMIVGCNTRIIKRHFT